LDILSRLCDLRFPGPPMQLHRGESVSSAFLCKVTADTTYSTGRLWLSKLGPVWCTSYLKVPFRLYKFF